MSVAMEEKHPSQGMRKSERSEDLITRFNTLYEVVPADTPELLEETFRLRYKVYSQSYPEGTNISKFPSQLETDAYDPRSVHVLLRHRASGTYVGNVRLVLCDADESTRPFPMEERMGHAFDLKAFGISGFRRRHLAEITRLIVTRDIPLNEGGAASDRSDFNIAVLGLFKAILKMGLVHRIAHYLAAIEPPLARLLRAYGVGYRVIGPPVDYYGMRQPTLASGHDIMDGIYYRRPDVWDLLAERGRIWPAPRTEKSPCPGNVG